MIYTHTHTQQNCAMTSAKKILSFVCCIKLLYGKYCGLALTVTSVTEQYIFLFSEII